MTIDAAWRSRVRRWPALRCEMPLVELPLAELHKDGT